MNYVVKTTELERKPRGVRGVLIFRSTAEKMGLAAACWRAKSADGGGNRRTSAKKNTRGRCGQQMESCAGGGTLSKKVCEKRKLDGRGGIIPTAERLRGKNYAPEKCAAEIRQAGKRGITLSESLRHHPQHMVYGNAAIVILRRFFINIIYREIIGIFSIAPRKPRNTGVPACQVRLFYIASAGLDKYFVRWYNICAKEQMFVSTRGVYPNHRPVSPGGYFNRKTEQMFD